MDLSVLIAQLVVGVGIILIGARFAYLTNQRNKTFDTKVIGLHRMIDLVSDRVAEHDVQNAETKKDIEYIKKASDETRKDIKQLLQIANGRASGASGS